MINKGKTVWPKLGLVPQNCVVRAESSLLSDYVCDTFYLPSDNGNPDAPLVPVERQCRDISVLFNEKRLQKLGNNVQSFIDSLKPIVHDQPNLNDDQLFSFIKSRFIQSPSELLAWSSYLSEQYGSEYQKVLDEMNARNSDLNDSDITTDNNTTDN